MTSLNDLTVGDVLAIKERINAGEYQHIIASDFGLNQGRISEIATGKRLGSIQSSRVRTNIRPMIKTIYFKHKTESR